jgi:hypothetical protein
MLLGWLTKFLCREISPNLAKYLFCISRNNFFISRNFATFCIVKFCKISYSEILQNFAKYHEIFVTKLKFSQGKIHFWILVHFNTTKKITFMSKIHASISVFFWKGSNDPDPCQNFRIRNTSQTFKKCWLKLILYVLNSQNLHSKTISWNNLYKILQNVLVFEKCP